MERVIAAMRRVVERLQTENDNLKKQSGKPKPHADLVKENRNLKVKFVFETDFNNYSPNHLHM